LIVEETRELESRVCATNITLVSNVFTKLGDDELGHRLDTELAPWHDLARF
jgi:hypothetical protein